MQPQKAFENNTTVEEDNTAISNKYKSPLWRAPIVRFMFTHPANKTDHSLRLQMIMDTLDIKSLPDSSNIPFNLMDEVFDSVNKSNIIESGVQTDPDICKHFQARTMVKSQDISIQSNTQVTIETSPSNRLQTNNLTGSSSHKKDEPVSLLHLTPMQLLALSRNDAAVPNQTMNNNQSYKFFSDNSSVPRNPARFNEGSQNYNYNNQGFAQEQPGNSKLDIQYPQWNKKNHNYNEEKDTGEAKDNFLNSSDQDQSCYPMNQANTDNIDFQRQNNQIPTRIPLQNFDHKLGFNPGFLNINSAFRNPNQFNNQKKQQMSRNKRGKPRLKNKNNQ